MAVVVIDSNPICGILWVCKKEEGRAKRPIMRLRIGGVEGILMDTQEAIIAICHNATTRCRAILRDI